MPEKPTSAQSPEEIIKTRENEEIPLPGANTIDKKSEEDKDFDQAVQNSIEESLRNAA